MAITTNMLIDLPTVSITLGPEWATKLNNAFIQRVDTHDHSTGKGVRVTPAGLNINTDLTFASNNADNLRSTRFISNGATLSEPSDIRSVYVVGGDLYYNNGAGTPVQITAGTSVQSSSDGVSRSFQRVAIASNTVIAPSDTFSFVDVDTTTTVQITLPLANAVAAGRFYVIADTTGQGRTNPITVTRSGSDTVDGVASRTISGNYGSMVFTGDGISKWSITSANDTTIPVTSNALAVFSGDSGRLRNSITNISSTTGSLELGDGTASGALSLELNNGSGLVYLRLQRNNTTANAWDIRNDNTSSDFLILYAGVEKMVLSDGTSLLTVIGGSNFRIRAETITNSATPLANTAYPKSLIKAWARTSSGGSVSDGFNLTCSSPGTGQYSYSMPRAMANTNYAVLVTASNANNLSGHYTVNNTTSFTVYITDGLNNLSNAIHSVMVIGVQS